MESVDKKKSVIIVHPHPGARGGEEGELGRNSRNSRNSRNFLRATRSKARRGRSLGDRCSAVEEILRGVDQVVESLRPAMAFRGVLWVALFAGVVAVGAGRGLPSEDVGSIAMMTDLNAGFAAILGNSKDVWHFAGFAAKFNKEYTTVEELKHRFATFLESVKLVETHNKEKHSYTLAVNEFADMSFEEFREARLMKGEQNCSATEGNHVMTSADLPKTKDWREEGIVSVVKNQASCGSCWTFSTTGALEAAHAQATGNMVLLSEQQLVDCAGEFNNFGCGGGLPSQAFEYIRYNGGIDTEASYPYFAKDSKCQFHNTTVGAKVWDVVNITEGAEMQLKHAVATMRPVSVAFEVVHDFRLYNGGVYTSDTCHTSPQTVNHAVLAVGYGEDVNGTPYWIIKNSWGAAWGVDGYFLMEMGKNMCGVSTCASYPVVPEDLKKEV